jgi:hypothetical protein
MRMRFVSRRVLKSVLVHCVREKLGWSFFAMMLGLFRGRDLLLHPL